MYKMLKVSEEAHAIIKERSARNKMSIIQYVDYIAKEELYASIEFENSCNTYFAKNLSDKMSEKGYNGVEV